MARSFRIASYNVLAKSDAKPLWYPNVDPAVLRWSNRKHDLAKRVERFDTDIICLQEVEPDAYGLLKWTLHAKGYDGIYAKSGNGVLSESSPHI
jgi:CCR4-NOT transcription complex subunit 6